MSIEIKIKQRSAGDGEAAEEPNHSKFFPLSCPHCKKIVDVDFICVKTPITGEPGWVVITRRPDGVHQVVSACGSEENARSVAGDNMFNRSKHEARALLRKIVAIRPAAAIHDRQMLVGLVHGICGTLEGGVDEKLKTELIKLLEDDTFDLEHIDDYVDERVHTLIRPTTLWWPATVEAAAA